MAVDRGPGQLPHQIGDKENDDGVQSADDKPRRPSVAPRKLDQVQPPAPGQDPDAGADQQHTGAAIGDHRPGGHRCHGIDRIGRGIGPKQMVDRLMGRAERRGQGRRHDQRPKHELRPDHPGRVDQPSQQRAANPAGARRAGAPDQAQGDRQEHDAQQIGQDVGGRLAHPEPAQKPDGDVAEGVPAHERGGPAIPEPCRAVGHRHDAEARPGRREQEPPEHQRHAQHQDRREIAQYQRPQDGRPREQHEGADAADRERCHPGEAEQEPCGHRPDAARGRVERRGCDACLEGGRDTPEQQLAAVADGGKAGQQQQDLECPMAGELFADPSSHPGHLVRDAGQGRGDILDVRLPHGQPPLDEARQPRGRWRSRLVRGEARRRLPHLALEPPLDHRVGQELQERSDLIGRRLRRLLRIGRGGGQQQAHQHEHVQQPSNHSTHQRTSAVHRE